MATEEKTILRKRIEDARRKEPEKEKKSLLICEQLAALPEFRNASTVMFYLSTPGEVDTRHCLEQALSGGKRCVVPYCLGDLLGLFILKDFSELAPGTFGILEPKPELRRETGRQCLPGDLELILVPGVAFDKKGGRLGRGKGFYDRFLTAVPANVPLIALAFACQLVNAVPGGPKDLPVSMIITETGIYDCGSWR